MPNQIHFLDQDIGQTANPCFSGGTNASFSECELRFQIIY